VAVKPAGQDSEALIVARNGDSTAPFAPECQSFLDNLPSSFGANGSANDPHLFLVSSLPKTSRTGLPRPPGPLHEGGGKPLPQRQGRAGSVCGAADSHNDKVMERRPDRASNINEHGRRWRGAEMLSCLP
jgi:hypothetical protein